LPKTISPTRLLNDLAHENSRPRRALSLSYHSCG